MMMHCCSCLQAVHIAVDCGAYGCSSGATAVVMEDSEIPELVSRTQPDTAPLKDEGECFIMWFM